MVSAFTSRLDRGFTGLGLPAGILHELRMQEIKLAGLQVPAGLDASTTAAIRRLVGDAFVFGFRIIMLICAGLSVASTMIVWFMIPKASPDEVPVKIIMMVHFVCGLIRVELRAPKANREVICFKMWIEVNLDDILIAKERQT